MNKNNKTVKAHKDRDGMVIFRLLRGKKQVQIFGYGTVHKIWLRMENAGRGTLEVTVEQESIVKESIAEWIK